MAGGLVDVIVTVKFNGFISYLMVVCVIVDRYLSELLSERNKLGPFVPVLPLCYRLLNQGKLVKLALLEFMASYAVPSLLLPLQTHYSIAYRFFC